MHEWHIRIHYQMYLQLYWRLIQKLCPPLLWFEWCEESSGKKDFHKWINKYGQALLTNLNAIQIAHELGHTTPTSQWLSRGKHIWMWLAMCKSDNGSYSYGSVPMQLDVTCQILNQIWNTRIHVRNLTHTHTHTRSDCILLLTWSVDSFHMIMHPATYTTFTTNQMPWSGSVSK